MAGALTASAGAASALVLPYPEYLIEQVPALTLPAAGTLTANVARLPAFASRVASNGTAFALSPSVVTSSGSSTGFESAILVRSRVPANFPSAGEVTSAATPIRSAVASGSVSPLYANGLSAYSLIFFGSMASQPFGRP